MQGNLSRNSKILLFSFFFYLILEGMLRKWFLPSLGQPLFLFKYVILIALYINYIGEGGKITFPATYRPFLAAYFVYGLLCFFNLRVSDNVIVPIFGLINHFIYMPLVSILARYFVDERQINDFIFKSSLVCIPIFILGVMQYYSPQDSILNRYATEQDAADVAVVGDKVRITGVFSYIATYAVFLYGIMFLLFYNIVNDLILKKYNIIKISIFIFGIINMFMIGSRGIVLQLGILIAVYLIVLTLTGRASILASYVPLILFGAVGFLIIANTEAGVESFTNFSDRLTQVGDAAGRIDRLLSPLMNLEVAGPFGLGLGVAYQGVQGFITDRTLLPSYFEEEGDRLVLEIGLVGYLLILTMRIMIFLYNVKVFRRTQRISLMSLSLLIALYQLPSIFGLSNMEFNYMDGAFFWTFGGIQYAIDLIGQRAEIKPLQNAA